MSNVPRVIPPHLNAEIYRTDATGTDTLSYLDYIRVHKDGSILIGCSELTGRYWNGGASVFKNIEEAQKEFKIVKKSIFLPNGTADGCFADSSSKVLLCEDNGALSIWSSDSEGAWGTWTKEECVAEHDDSALAVECLNADTEYVTVGADGNAKVWDINDMICIRNYKGAHNMAISGLSVRPNSITNFATASTDCYASLWDANIEKPVLELVRNDCGLRCLQWLDENRIVYGDEAGALRVGDIRNTQTLHKIHEFPTSVHKVLVQNGSNKVAVCCDNRVVSICALSDDNNATESYRNKDLHSNYVRGLAWDACAKDLLHTVGWDGEIKTHKFH